MREKRIIRFYYWLIKRMPKMLQYLTAIDLVAKSTTGKHGKTIVPELTAMDAIKRFEKDYKIWG